MNKEKEVPYGTQYPQEVLNAMPQLAQAHGRSLNSEIVWALWQYIKEQKGEDSYADHKKDQA